MRRRTCAQGLTCLPSSHVIIYLFQGSAAQGLPHAARFT